MGEDWGQQECRGLASGNARIKVPCCLACPLRLSVTDVMERVQHVELAVGFTGLRLAPLTRQPPSPVTFHLFLRLTSSSLCDQLLTT